MALRYGWQLTNTPACGKDFTLEHVLSCPKGGFHSIRQNEIRYLSAQLMSEVCHSVLIEPDLQRITGEPPSAQLDIAANGFLGSRFEKTYTVFTLAPVL